ncbi:MAG: hypothetical protein EBZ91_13425 [Gammaproteobacteria bacterium]|nr:hypothetical protein [Gammaproteobacteria bacterium]
MGNYCVITILGCNNIYVCIGTIPSCVFQYYWCNIYIYKLWNDMDICINITQYTWIIYVCIWSIYFWL